MSPPEGMFYMADFVMEEAPDVYGEGEESLNIVRESGDGDTLYSSPEGHKRFILKEIRFEQAYHS